MLIPLHGRALRTLQTTSTRPFLVRLHDGSSSEPIGPYDALLVSSAGSALPSGYRAYLGHSEFTPPPDADAFVLGREMHYLGHGDVVRLDPVRSAVAALYRRHSPSNSILLTERCDNFCLMCSQPPKERNDDWIVQEVKELIPLLASDTAEIGLTGGEPALLGADLIEVVRLLGIHLPNTAVHVLTNGRGFHDATFAKSLGKIGHPNLMMGVPVYSALPEDHDHVVQRAGAFSETIRGILNLKRSRVAVEIRTVLHAATYRRLPELADFLARNLLFVDHVALMGLELMGFAKTNLESLWIDPVDYQAELLQACTILDRAGMPFSIYNLPLCVLDPELHRFARRSISDWKNAFFEECEPCSMRGECAGFFASSRLRRSRGVKPIISREVEPAALGST